MSFSKLLYFLVLFLVFTNINAQKLEVIDTKKTTFINGTKIKKHSFLSLDDTVIIAEKGFLTLKEKDDWEIWLYKGRYGLDSCYQKHKEIHFKEDSLKAIIDSIFPDGLIDNGSTEGCGVPLLGKSEEERKKMLLKMGHIVFYNSLNIDSNTLEIKDSVTINFKDPNKEFDGRYYLIVRNYFNEVIDFQLITNRKFILKLEKYYETEGIDNKFIPIMISVYTSDNRNSSNLVIKEKTD